MLTETVLIVAMARNAKALKRLPIMSDAVDIDGAPLIDLLTL